MPGPVTRALMSRIDFIHGGPEYDAKYPDGISTEVEIQHRDLAQLSSGLVMYPPGHARSPSHNLSALLEHKLRVLASLGVGDTAGLHNRLMNLSAKSAAEIRELYSFEIKLP